MEINSLVRLGALLVATCLSAGCASEIKPGYTTPQEVDDLETIAEVERYVYHLTCTLHATGTEYGATGFLLKNGLVVTAGHFIQSCGNAQIYIHVRKDDDSNEYTVLVGRFSYIVGQDIALLEPKPKLRGDGLPLNLQRVVSIKSESITKASYLTEGIVLGKRVALFGFPGNLPADDVTVTFGRIARRLSGNLIVINGVGIPGMSGSPVWDFVDQSVLGVWVSKPRMLERPDQADAGANQLDTYAQPGVIFAQTITSLHAVCERGWSSEVCDALLLSR